MTVLHLLNLVLEAIQVIGSLAVPCAIVASIGKEDFRFAGAKLGYRS